MELTDNTLTLLIALGVTIFFFIPTIVASRRNNPKVDLVFILNIAIGWTAVGWVIALICALAKYDRPQK